MRARLAALGWASNQHMARVSAAVIFWMEGLCIVMPTASMLLKTIF
tara:strand:+ start:105 stop:242 length:138 start_codon:yes stop_codon:yes gene_type:complete